MSSISNHWQLNPEIKTRSQLLEFRKRNSVPDISYDLDGDGVVGGKDYVISRRFDRTSKGHLDKQEQKEAFDFLKQGKDKVYLWGCEASKTVRITQKRGVTIIADDDSKLTDTYPKLQRPHPRVKTQSELVQEHKERARNEGEKISKKIGKSFRKTLSFSDIIDQESYVLKPMHSSFLSKVHDGKMQQRKKIGLDIPTTLSCTQEIPLIYRNKPKFNTCSEMHLTRKQEEIDTLNSSANYSHKNAEERLEQREAECFQNIFKGKTYKKIKKRRRNLDFEYSNRVFGNKPIGVHRNELPKYFDNLKEYWAIGREMTHKQMEKESIRNENPGNKSTHQIRGADMQNHREQTIYKPRMSSFTTSNLKFRLKENNFTRPMTVRVHDIYGQNDIKMKPISIRSSGFQKSHRIKLNKK